MLGWLSAAVGPRFQLEAAQAIGVIGEGGGEDLDGHRAPELGIVRPVHFAHAAGVHQRDDFVAPQSRPGSRATRAWLPRRAVRRRLRARHAVRDAKHKDGRADVNGIPVAEPGRLRHRLIVHQRAVLASKIFERGDVVRRW